MELGNPDSLPWRYILMNFFNTLADDHGGAQSQLWGARDIPSSCIMRKKCYFLLLIARVYICTHFPIKRKRHRHFLGFSFAAKLDFSKIVATGRSQVKLSSSETIRIHYCFFLHTVVGFHHKAENGATFLLMFECWVSCGKGSLNA